MITVRDILDKKGRAIWTISPEAKVIDALRLMAEKNIGAVVVTESDVIVGIFSERDYARKIILHRRQSNDTPVRDIMTTQVCQVHPGTTAGQCLSLFTERHIRHLPVTEGGGLVGLVSIGDVVKVVTSDLQITIENLEDFIGEHP